MLEVSFGEVNKDVFTVVWISGGVVWNDVQGRSELQRPGRREESQVLQRVLERIQRWRRKVALRGKLLVSIRCALANATGREI